MLFTRAPFPITINGGQNHLRALPRLDPDGSRILKELVKFVLKSFLTGCVKEKWSHEVAYFGQNLLYCPPSKDIFLRSVGVN